MREMIDSFDWIARRVERAHPSIRPTADHKQGTTAILIPVIRFAWPPILLLLPLKKGAALSLVTIPCCLIVHGNRGPW